MNTKHTPHTKGPWRRDKYGVVIDANGNPVRFRSISIACSGPHVQEAEANTDLAAAAPELLEALRKYMDAGFGESTDFRIQGEAYDAAVNAIAKATGANHVHDQ